MRIPRASALLLVLLLAAPLAAAQTDEEVPCLRPVDAKCLVGEVRDETDAVIDYGHSTLDYTQELLDWVECQLTSYIWCGTVPQPPLPPYVEGGLTTTAAASACNLSDPEGCDVGPCARAAWPHTGPEVDPGTVGCYTTWVFDTVDELIVGGGDMVAWARAFVDWVECALDGGGFECDSPPPPPVFELSASQATVAAFGEPVGPCATVYLIHPGPAVDPGTVGCYTTWTFDTVDELLVGGGDMVAWARAFVDWVECALDGGGFECDSPPLPRLSSVTLPADQTE